MVRGIKILPRSWVSFSFVPLTSPRCGRILLTVQSTCILGGPRNMKEADVLYEGGNFEICVWIFRGQMAPVFLPQVNRPI